MTKEIVECKGDCGKFLNCEVTTITENGTQKKVFYTDETPTQTYYYKEKDEFICNICMEGLTGIPIRKNYKESVQLNTEINEILSRLYKIQSYNNIKYSETYNHIVKTAISGLEIIYRK